MRARMCDQVRCERPTREMVNDKVQLQLQRQEALIQAYLARLNTVIKTADASLFRLERCIKKLQADLNDKVEALALDQRVLEGDMPDAKPCTNVSGGAVGLHPHKWNQSTEERIREANKWSSDSARLRQEAKRMMSEKDEAARQINNGLNNSMLGKLQETDDLKAKLTQRLDETRREIEEAKQRKFDLEQALEAKRGPTQQAVQRLVVRKTRPRRERVDDEAHQALVAELRNLTGICSQLRDK
eukprot:evm.model.scf_1559.3 EVM.evm.TU.scf_1559.3   scf_1559:11528-16232(+)